MSAWPRLTRNQSYRAAPEVVHLNVGQGLWVHSEHLGLTRLNAVANGSVTLSHSLIETAREQHARGQWSIVGYAPLSAHWQVNRAALQGVLPRQRVWSLVSLGRYSTRFIIEMLPHRWRESGRVIYEEIGLPVTCGA